jgi:hypothetical protein
LPLLSLLAQNANTDAEMPPQAFVFLSVDGSSFFTLRGLKLLRLLKPLGQLVLFSDLETVFDTIKKAIAPMVRQYLYFCTSTAVQKCKYAAVAGNCHASYRQNLYFCASKAVQKYKY